MHDTAARLASARETHADNRKKHRTLTDGDDSFSDRTTPFNTSSVSDAPVGYTMPGQSMRKMRFMSVMYCQTLVSPGMGATLQLFFFTSVLMTLLLPTFG